MFLQKRDSMYLLKHFSKEKLRKSDIYFFDYRQMFKPQA